MKSDSSSDTVSPSEKHTPEEAADFHSLFDNPLWTNNSEETPANLFQVIEPSSRLKWPLSHGERIEELRSFLIDPRYAENEENIRAVIEYHETFNSKEQCGSEKAFFKHGFRVDEDEYYHTRGCNCIAGGWEEVPPIGPPWYSIDDRVDDANRVAIEEPEARHEREKEREPRALHKDMFHELGSLILKPFRQLIRVGRN